jgi:hypothetical protein
MPVSGRWLDEPPPRPPIRKYTVIGISLLLIVLAARVLILGIIAPSSAVVAPAPATATLRADSLPAVATPHPAAQNTAVAAVAPSATPTTTPSATPTALPANCPPAASVPEGARVGWLARASGCPDVLYASVGGVRQWVRRPDGFPEALLSQLPELPTP